MIVVPHFLVTNFNPVANGDQTQNHFKLVNLFVLLIISALSMATNAKTLMQ